MAYMSYCRQEGTFEELRCCMADVDDHIRGEAEYEISDREISCFRKMVNEFVWFLNEYELIDEFGDVDNLRLDEICELMAKKKGDFENEEDPWNPAAFL
jgi:hypothetical protein